MSDGQLLLVCGALLVVALSAAMIAGRVRVPGLLVVLGLGMAVGSDGTGWISFDDFELARTIGILALTAILFEGGLSAGWQEIRPVLVPAVSLAAVGTIVTAVIAGFAASWLFGFSTLEGMLVGSIVASTDGAAIFALLRGSTLKRRLARTLEGEAGLNDPMAVLLVLGFIDWIQKPGFGVFDMAGKMVVEIAVGAAVGLLLGRGAVFALQRVRLGSTGLYPVASVAVAALAFGLADTLHGSGFLSVYLTGLAIGGAPSPARRTIVTFHEGLAWVGQIAMFFSLGLLVFPSQLGDVWLEGTLLALVTVGLARTVSVVLATTGMGFMMRERLVLGWAGLRGAVPVVLATFPVIAGVPESMRFFNIAFFAVLVSTLLQGTTFEGFARRLGVTTSESALPSQLVDPATIRLLGAETTEYAVGPDDAIVDRPVRELGLPREALLNIIVRDNQAIPPRGSTRISAGDRLHVLVRQESAVEFRGLLKRWREGPIGPPPRPPRAVRNTPSIFTVRPWREADGDPGRAETVNGIPVVVQLRTRRDVPGALVELADGRFAVAGPLLLLGGSNQIREAAGRRLRLAGDDAERAWWREVIGALAAART